MYASYIIMYIGYLQLAFSWLNVTIVIATLTFILARIYFEEQILSTDSTYLEYSKKVPYRLLPFVF
jgi:protein-S-isoprenylcysteine O-methyltransferase Ste14